MELATSGGSRMTHLVVLLAVVGAVAELLLLLTWWLERPIPEEPFEDRSRGTADTPRGR